MSDVYRKDGQATHDAIAQGLADELGIHSNKLKDISETCDEDWYQWKTGKTLISIVYAAIINGKIIISDGIIANPEHRSKTTNVLAYDLNNPNLIEQLRTIMHYNI